MSDKREYRKRPLLILTGPTAVGKTGISIDLAKAIGGEIISADSMQVYRHMDIGSAKITCEEMDGVPHHLIDVMDPTEDFNVVVFKQMAQAALKDIYSRGRIPIVVGGTGFYIQALLYDIDFTKEKDDGSVRRELEQMARERGPNAMHQLLAEIDPDSAAAIHANNQKRVIRAIEFYRQTGKRISEHNREEREKSSPYQFLYYVINTDRELLYRRIDSRVDQMIGNGLLKEVERLADMGLKRDMVSMQGLGYKEMLDYLDGKCTWEEAVITLKRDTRHFAKRQITWFKRERDVRWINLPDFDDSREKVIEKISADVRKLLEGLE